ncbi:hypothetical protein FRC09_020312 [Ceratobasidium sp. 395]|nr:hypothetical protein FRC09_020312 [Ceratobasidium sp. 395]
MAEERTVSAFTKINSPDRARQKAYTIVNMTKILQHEQRKYSLEPLPLTTFREIPGLVNLVDQPIAQPGADSAEQDINAETVEAEVGEADEMSQRRASGEITQDEEQEAASMEIPGEWEDQAGLDEEIEPAATGDKLEFKSVESDGIDLTSRYLLGVLSDKLTNMPLITPHVPSSGAHVELPAPVIIHAVAVQF